MMRESKKPYLEAVAASLIYHGVKSSSTVMFAYHHGDGA